MVDKEAILDTFVLNLQHFLIKLPPCISELPILNIKHMGANNTESQVRREKVLQVLLWLHNMFYRNIEIDYDNISCLPTDGIPDAILTLTTDTATSETPFTRETEWLCGSLAAENTRCWMVLVQKWIPGKEEHTCTWVCQTEEWSRTLQASVNGSSG